MKKLYTIILLSLAVTACSKKHLAIKSAKSNNAAKAESATIAKNKALSASKDYERAMVVNFKGRDGCDYALQLENGENLEPNLLPEGFQQDSLKVWVKFEVRKNTASICMIGRMVNVLEIKKR